MNWFKINKESMTKIALTLAEAETKRSELQAANPGKKYAVKETSTGSNVYSVIEIAASKFERGDSVSIKNDRFYTVGRVIGFEKEGIIKVDLGDTKPYYIKEFELEKVSDNWNTLVFDDKVNKTKDLTKKAIEHLEKREVIHRTLANIQNAIKFEDEFDNNWITGVKKEPELKTKEFGIGDKIQHIASKNNGKIIRINEKENNYRIKWDNGIITTNWLQEFITI